ncbi:hypothetical protein C8046_03695 [Serinibacter arcticus]|uniref:N-acetyltransferase domain-containing protein n=1 Tax=Serinibacter arcticus TaxID=1655435 RepID=A0A2U1ZSF5_9MICO|nr:GNAT family N-acetyltransferase [Serinibacter arcticus]PWD49917.1 hypothetical protein C8046_03695 [Serinibacter arcticus]
MWSSRFDIRPFAAGDVGAVVALTASTFLRRAASTGVRPDVDAATVAAGVVRGFLDDPARSAFVAAQGDRVVGFLGSITTRLRPADDAFTYQAPISTLVPLAGACAADADWAVRSWPYLFDALREQAGRDGVDRVGVQALAGDAVAGAVWRARGLRLDQVLAFRPVAPIGVEPSPPPGVRPANGGDVEALADLLRSEIVHHARETGCGVSEVQERSTLVRLASGWVDHRAPENVGRAFVAEQGGRVVGVVVVDVLTVPGESPATFALSRRHGYIGLASTAPDRRGRGVGSALTARALAWLRSLPEPPDQVGLHYVADNALGATFWARRGFAPVLETWVARP